MSKQDKRPGLKNHAIISTAFQDHISKQLQLNLHLNSNLSNLKHKNKKIEAKSKIDTGLSLNKKLKNKNQFENGEEEKEYILNKTNSKDIPTLAEKYGLIAVEDDTKYLDESEWLKIKEKYKQRQEYKEPCVICKEQLGVNQQVLLSCSHTFHRNCLERFEKFSGKKCCPMCRKERYKTRVVFDASKHYKHLCASKIQAAWRGYLVRKWYKNYRKLVPPQNPILRRKFFEDKLSDITNRICMSFNYETDLLLNDIDNNIKQSRETFKSLDEKLKVIPEEKWAELFEKAVNRDHDECSICMNKYNTHKDYFKRKSQLNSLSDTKNDKQVVLLSCSHLFHSICLNTYEELNFDKISVCPECRSAYKKYELI